jgi:hypothetical protein
VDVAGRAGDSGRAGDDLPGDDLAREAHRLEGVANGDGVVADRVTGREDGEDLVEGDHGA